MLMTFVVLPQAFAASHFVDPSYHLNTEVFLRGIDSNGLILVDADERLYDELCDYVEQLAAIGKGKRTHALFEELLKKKRQQVKRFVVTRCSVDAKMMTCDAATQFAKDCRAEIVLVDPMGHSQIASAIAGRALVISVPEYISSPVEDERRRCCENLTAVDLMATGEFDSLIERCTQYSTWLRFFDKQIGKANNLKRFRLGVERVLRLWLQSAHFPLHELHAELFTVVDDSRYAKLPPYIAHRRVLNDLVRPLEQELSVRIDLYFKKDIKSICHSRHLQTQSVAISFEKGFDFVGLDGRLSRNFIKIDGGCLDHLQQYRHLPNYTPPT